MSENIKDLLPRNKQDMERAQAIAALNYADTVQFFPELITWLQDINWPVAQVIAPYLAQAGLSSVPAIRRVLQTDDHIWKYWVLSAVVAEASPEVAITLKSELERLVTSPSTDEIAEGIHQIAQEIFAQSNITKEL